jgi:hypothetical protein
MTQRRAAGPGPRTVAPHRVIGSRPAAVLAALAVLVASVALAACGATSNLSSGPGSPGPGSSAGGVPSAAPSGGALGPAVPSGAPGSAAPGSPEASPPRWPGTTVLAVLALGGADGEIRKAGDDLQAAANAEDLKAMWGAADGLARMIDGLMPDIDRLEVYAGTRPVAALYRKALPELLAGAKQLRDSISSGDSAGVVAGSQAISHGLADYGPIREQIAGLVEQAIVQQRLLVK